MIHVPRTSVRPPDVLEKQNEAGRIRGALKKHLKANKPIETFKFSYQTYKHEEVKDALMRLFHGKCAYCESRYAGTQPMDVEHWRPKAAVVATRGPKYGYFWLAAEWQNLFPSCIDCNRSRLQFDVRRKKTVTCGKANQFPLRDESVRPDPGSAIGDVDAFVAELVDAVNHETPLLLDPCRDQVSRFFRYDEFALVWPADRLSDADREKAEVSIQVYALNRSELVADRLAVRKLVDGRIVLIGELRRIRRELDPLRGEPRVDITAVQASLDNLVADEIDRLHDMEAEHRPYSAMVREMLADALAPP